VGVVTVLVSSRRGFVGCSGGVDEALFSVEFVTDKGKDGIFCSVAGRGDELESEIDRFDADFDGCALSGR
jgi:hypothetical protein